MNRRGILIVIEGLDRSGKSTQVKLLLEALSSQNIKCELMRFPNRTTSIGNIINSYLNKEIELDDHAAHLLFSANRWECVKTIHDKLNSGVSLIFDRYAYSGVVYSAAKSGMDFEWCKQCDTGLPKPDLVFFMDTKRSNVICERDQFGQERYEKAEFQNLVYDNFKKLFKLDQPNSNECIPIDAKDTIDSIHKIILKYVIDLIKSNNLTLNEIGCLW